MSEPQVEKSAFVNVIAWLSIAGSALMSLIGVIQNILLYTVFPDFEAEIPQINPTIDMIISNLDVFFGLFLVYSLFLLVASIGLLRRINWARVLFVALLVLSLVWMIGGFAMVSGEDLMPNDPALAIDEEFGSFFTMLTYANYALNALIFAVTLWLAVKLCREPILSEFR